MLDPKLLREDPDAVRAGVRRRGDQRKLALVDEAIECDKEWRALKTQVDELRHRQNELTAEIADMKRKGSAIEERLGEVKEIPARIKSLETNADEKYTRLTRMLMSVPNILNESVPMGADESANVVVRQWGKQIDFGFEPKHHIDILVGLGLADMDRAAKIAGARFSFLMGDAVKLEHAIMQYAVDFLKTRGFKVLEPPFMLNRAAYEGVVNIEDFGPVIYKVEGEDLHLIATSEHPLVSMHMDEILDGSALPIKYCGLSPCFREEAGAHGKDTKGIFRVHQFYKVEQVVFSKPEESWARHEELVSNVERIYQDLKIPYRVMLLSSGDTGFMSAKT
jgi:seryl-tRNA synthetase